MLRAIALVAALSAPAFAETSVDVGFGHHERTAAPRTASALRFGATTKGTRLEAVSVKARGLRATAMLTLSSTSKDGQDAALEFEVPLGTQVTYLGLTMGGERRIAHLESSAAAAAEYERIVEGDIDPVLLEWTSSTETTDKLRLRVFPLVRGKPAKLEVIMTLPPAASLVIDPGRQRIASLPRPVRIALDDDAARTVLDGVDADRSLFIAEPFLGADALERARRSELVRRQEQRDERPRGAIRIAQECLNNPLAASCM